MIDWNLDEKLEKMLKDYEAENIKNGTIDKPVFASGQETYSARRIIDEVRRGTPIGRQYAKTWQKLEESKNQQAYENDETEFGGES